MEHTITCPLCGTKINHKKINSRYKDPDPTHAWSCPICPFVAFEFYTNKNTKDLEKYLNKKITPYCLYCDKKRPSKHFLCEVCGIGMCDDCYDNLVEHDDHYHRVCENADQEEYNLVIKKIGHEPEYICNKCLGEITKSITI